MREHSDNWQIAKRLEAIRLLHSCLTVVTVSKQLCVNQEIVYKYIKTYKEDGITGLVTLDKPGKESKLSEEQWLKIEKFIEDSRREKLKCTTNDQVAFVKKHFGIEIGAKWLYKRLLIRKQRRMDGLTPVLLFLTAVGNELTFNRVYRRSLFLLIQSISTTPVFHHI